MNKEVKIKFGSSELFTIQALDSLISKGYRYVMVNAFTHNKRQDYMEPSYFVLVPIKDLPDDPEKKGIYEPIGSPLLLEWAKYPDRGIQVLVTMG